MRNEARSSLRFGKVHQHTMSSRGRMGKIDFADSLVYPHPLLYAAWRRVVARFGEWRTCSGQLRLRRVQLLRGVARSGTGVYSRPIQDAGRVSTVRERWFAITI